MKKIKHSFYLTEEAEIELNKHYAWNIQLGAKRTMSDIVCDALMNDRILMNDLNNDENL